ncbi:MAG TPA: SRPBCC domain-containing protein [Kofleriaceae bacterium]|nr:SRPBCC domain-containing protein [Kofleriaceae bacterium]
MYSIENTIDIHAPAARIVEALTTQSGIEGWWTTDTDVCDREATFRFGKQGDLVEVRFAIEDKTASRVALTCIAETNNADWLGTELVFALSPIAGGTRVALVHAGYPAKNEVYANCVEGWAFFLDSLKRYLETGRGEPHVRKTKDIVDAIEIAAPPERVLGALTTSAGIAAWWTTNNTVEPGRHVYRFGKGDARAEETFRVERQDARGIALACVAERNGIGWLGTRLAFALEPAGTGTRVALTHARFPAESGCYDDCVAGWKHFLGSLKGYLETGTGAPAVDACK